MMMQLLTRLHKDGYGLFVITVILFIASMTSAQPDAVPAEPEGLSAEQKAERREQIRQEMTAAYRAQFANKTLADYTASISSPAIASPMTIWARPG